MLPTFRRCYSSASATSIASEFLAKYQGTNRDTPPTQKQTQFLDINQLQRLSATLSRRELLQASENGTPLPACYHLAYFTPSQVEEELGLDGTDTTFNPPIPFTRRMWAGGELEWVGGEANRLKTGQHVAETTKLLSAEGKQTRAGEEMVVVGVEKTYTNKKGVSLVDRRNWIFRPQITTPQVPASRPVEVPLPEGTHTRDLIQTPVTLFRFSALTFNAHKIHYNKEWCREVEGHRDLVVHGPLNLINMVNLWRDVQGQDVVPKKVTYRATSPLYAGEKYRVIMDEETLLTKTSKVRIVDSYGNTSMVGQIEGFGDA